MWSDGDRKERASGPDLICGRNALFRRVLIRGDDQVTMVTVVCAWIRVLLLARKAVETNNKLEKALLELEG